MPNVLCFGLGYSAAALAAELAAAGWGIAATATTPAGAARIAALGYEAFVFDGRAADPALAGAIGRASHVLVSAPPGTDGDPVLAHFAREIAAAPGLCWIGYLSTIGVYGDRQGQWVDEETPVAPQSERSARRADAERGWLDLAMGAHKPVFVFRLAGIYGPGRSAIDNLREGTARRIVKPGQVFNRIHRDDIAGVLAAAIARQPRHAIYNVTDDEPAPPQDVIAYAAGLLGLPVPPEVAFERAALSRMGASFYAENKRASNARAKGDLGWRLRYPTYREGLAAIAALG